MVEVSCFLIKKKIVSDSIGVQKEIEEKKEALIIRHEDIYSKEFYEADITGKKPTLRIVVSSLEFNDEEELEYCGKRYTIIRSQIKDLDEVILICERKLKNV